MPLLKVTSTELISGVSGESEENIRAVFEKAIVSSNKSNCKILTLHTYRSVPYRVWLRFRVCVSVTFIGPYRTVTVTRIILRDYKSVRYGKAALTEPDTDTLHTERVHYASVAKSTFDRFSREKTRPSLSRIQGKRAVYPLHRRNRGHIPAPRDSHKKYGTPHRHPASFLL